MERWAASSGPAKGYPDVDAYALARVQKVVWNEPYAVFDAVPESPSVQSERAGDAECDYCVLQSVLRVC